MYKIFRQLGVSYCAVRAHVTDRLHGVDRRSATRSVRNHIAATAGSFIADRCESRPERCLLLERRTLVDVFGGRVSLGNAR